MFVAIAVGLLFVFLSYQLHRRYDKFNSAGIPYKPAIPIFGSLWKSAFRKIHIYYDLHSVYNDYGDEKTRYVGFFNLTTPVIIAKDIELIKRIGVKDFESFTDHSIFNTEAIEPIVGKSILALTGQKWRDMRATLSPAFTSSKMRDMHTFVNDCAQQMVLHIVKVNDSSNGELELKELSSRFMNDAIVSSAFGVQVNSFKDKDNEFFLNGRLLTDTSFLDFLKLSFSSNFPTLAKILRLRVFSAELDNFYTETILSNMKYRKGNNIVRRDMIHLLMEAKKGSLEKDESRNGEVVDAGFSAVEESDAGLGLSKSELTDVEIIAQAMIFYFGGFDTTSTVTTFALYELALNADVQAKLHREIDELIRAENVDITYDAIINLKYLDMVISETLRKWPPANFTERKCLKDYDLGPVRREDATTYTIKTNDSIWIPIYSIHYDSTHWRDPNTFDPERFSDENKGNIKPFTFMPFGVGPRNCIGSRFALMTTKTMLFHLMSQFRIELSDRTTTPLELDVNKFAWIAKGGIWAKFVPHKNEIYI